MFSVISRSFFASSEFVASSRKMKGLVVVYRLLFEQLVVYHLPPAKEQGYPRLIECATEDEDGEYQPVVNQEYDAEDDEAQQREHHRQRLPRQEVVHPQVVAHSLHQVAHQLGVEERHRQFQQLHEEVVDERDVYLHRYSTFGRSQSPYG